MKFIKEVLLTIIEPFRKFGTFGLTEKTTIFLNKHKYILYIIALIVTGLIIFIFYFLE